MTVDELFGSPGFPIICILVLIEAMHIIYDEYVKVIDIRTIAVTDKWVREAFETIAIRLMTVDYNGRHERTSVEKGAYRTQFIIDKNMKLQSILSICVSPDEHFNDEKNDECYTQLTDVAKELMHYKHHFKGQVVFHNCDNPTWSAFLYDELHYVRHSEDRGGCGVVNGRRVYSRIFIRKNVCA